MDDNEITPGCKIPVNAHAPIKDGTVFSHDRVFVCTGKNDSKTQRVDADFFEKEKKNLRFQTNLWTWPQCYFVASKSCSKWTLTKSGLEQTEWDSQPRSELMTQTQSTGWQRGFP